MVVNVSYVTFVLRSLLPVENEVSYFLAQSLDKVKKN